MDGGDRLPAGTGSRPAASPGAERARRAEEVFEGSPFGTIVGDSSGVVLAVNPAAKELLGAQAGPQEHASRCCDLFGCRRPGGPLEHGCITELAVEAEDELPEIRIDLEHKVPASAIWVMAATLRPDRSRVVFQLRRGRQGDRRRRTVPHWTADPVVRVFALGETRIESAEGPIGGDWLEQRPGQLLKYLLCERRRVVPTDEIAEAIWPKASHLALGNVRHVIHVLRDRLEPERPKGKPSSFVVARTGGYTIDRDHVEIDVDLFERRVKSGLAAFAGNDDFAAAKELEEGLELYEADFLADEPYAEWAFAERERLRELARQGLWALAEVGKRKHDLDGAAACLQKLAEMLPFDSDVQRELLTLALRRGRRTEAMRRYNALRIRLLREFGEPPDFELSDLAGESLQSRGA